MPFKDKIVEIMGKALDVSENTNIDVFVEYSPHCKLFEVRIFTSGWSSSIDPDAVYRLYLDSPANGFSTYEDVDTQLDDILCELNTISQKVVVLQ